jgi:hypothetical protein
MIRVKKPPCGRRWLEIRQSMRFRVKTSCVYDHYTTYIKGGLSNEC